VNVTRTIFDATPCEGCGRPAWRHDNPDDLVPLCRECWLAAAPWEPDDEDGLGFDLPTMAVVTVDTRGRT
jgi:hypothetical protein